MKFISERDPIPGKLLLNAYVVVGKAGSGAVSDVYLARQRSVGNRNVAIKILKKLICASDSTDAEVHKKRFLFEAELLAMLKSGSFAHLIDAGTIKDDVERPFMVMEYLAGVQLSEHLKNQRRFPFPSAARILLFLCEGMQELHRYKVAYRDLSPSNVILEEGGATGVVPRLFDFSHAIVPGVGGMDAAGEAGSLLMGTPPFAAPELASGRGDERCDIYSLGTLFYVMVSGELPLGMKSPTWKEYVEAVASARNVPDKPLRKLARDVPKDLDDVIAGSMNPRPERRYQTVQEFVTDFCEVLVRSPLLRKHGTGQGALANLVSRLLLRG